MFHQGTLQDGIAKAVEESKSVVCFVTDDGSESATWENEWLQDQSIPNSIESQAIALRLEAASQEASFLAAFCSISDTPTVVVIYQGQLLDQLKSGISKNEFTLRLLASISHTQATPASNIAPSMSQQSTSSNRELSSSQTSIAPTPPPSQPTSTSNQTQDPESTSTSSRARRPNDTSYAEQQTQRKREAKIERERILRIIENDRIERREREEQRRRDAQAQAQEDTEVANGASIHSPSEREPLHSMASPSTTSPSATARIQIRLMDGSTLRTTFPSSTTLSAVKSWIHTECTDIGHAYTLKQILTPKPSRELSKADEQESLSDLGLAPSAALVMVQAKGAVSSYTSRLGVAGDGGTFDTIRAAIARLWAWIVDVVMSIVAGIRMFLGLDHVQQQGGDQSAQRGAGAGAGGRTTGTTGTTGSTERPSGNAKASSASGSAGSGGANAGSGIRIRTLRDQQDRDRDKDQSFYNGNQLNFEPRGKDEDDDYSVA